MAISAMPATDDQIEPQAKLIESLAEIRTGRRRSGIQSAIQIIQEFDKSKLVGEAAAARLSVAEALAGTSEHSLARQLTLSALGFFEQRGIWESVWRGRVVAVRASNDSAEAEANMASAHSAFAQLKKIWPAGSVESYMQRPDIKLLCSGLSFQ